MVDKSKCLVISESKKDDYDNALSDFLCWISGFKAGGGTYSPGSEGVIMDLRDNVRRAYTTTNEEGK